MAKYRTERDSLGAVSVPAEALYGASTQRAVDNFPISGLHMPRRFIEALGLIKAACASVNGELGLLSRERAEAIAQAAEAVAKGRHDSQFPVDVFQTGSGTSSNMNANEVIATLAGRSMGDAVHPNDEVNLGQSSNDVIPSATHVAVALVLDQNLLPALGQLETTVLERAAGLADTVKTGRTHLMDAVPLTLGQELGGWAAQLAGIRCLLDQSGAAVRDLALGGTAVGSGLNAHPELGARVAARLSEATGIGFREAPNHFAAQSGIDGAVAVSGHLRGLAIVLLKITNDLRWMNSGPLAGLGEISLPALQPGSSIMPGKVNPVIPEAVAMVGAQVIGNDAAITVAGQSGNFQLNVMWPLVAHNLIQSAELLANACRVLAERCIAGFKVNPDNLQRPLAQNPVLVTALNPLIGYEQAAEIAKRALAEGRPIREVAGEMSGLDAATLDQLLDPRRLTTPGDTTGE